MKIKFNHREPIGSSTYPMPNQSVDFGRMHNLLGEGKLKRTKKATLYIHIPFCDQICSFCGFNKTVSTTNKMDIYVDALIKEIKLYSNFKKIKNMEFHAVYLGGGTPNSLSLVNLTKILKAIKEYFPIVFDCEITCEGTPQNFTGEMNESLKSNGVNRISAGIQTFNQKIRKEYLHMNNGKEELLNYVAQIKKDFSNFNLDMIFNLPNQTDDIWHDDLETALSLNSSHLTIYPLVLLENTIFYSDYVKNETLAPPSQEKEIELFLKTVKRMAESSFSNFYSVRDWAKPNFGCRYIELNANNNNILALGAGSHGFLENFTYKNIRSIDKYIKTINNGLQPIDAQYFCNEEDLMRRHLVMGLRLNTFNFKSFHDKFGETMDSIFGKDFNDLIESGYFIRKNETLFHTTEGLIYGNNLRTYFETQNTSNVGYSDTTSIGESGKDHYSKITRIKAKGDVEANIK